MSEKIYLHLLFFCGILWQGVFTTFSGEDNRVSSDFLVRKRRVINHTPSGRNLPQIADVNYIVKIREDNRGICAGVILSHYTVITAALCIRQRISRYKILSGSAYDQRSKFHNITSKDEYYGSPPHQFINGIVLLSVDPPFEYNRNTGYAELHVGVLPAGTQVTVIGWGYLYPLSNEPVLQPRLRSITLPIMDHAQCQFIYRNNSIRANFENALVITEKHICTYCERQYCARGDAGAPLVIDNKLAGIHVWKGEFRGRMNPDVYINLQRNDYRNWIIDHSLLM